ncbi:hypothetical protein PAHAL_9G420400 [Panicum hallii]|uniref:Uncharacterized protein n=1 Tax=Panicum hallii TaxID=206008 RepID=A0A2S3IPK5_9POAL|nr:hypothetical protein PAHAL_9G420400 [Panicum hallii]
MSLIRVIQDQYHLGRSIFSVQFFLCRDGKTLGTACISAMLVNHHGSLCRGLHFTSSSRKFCVRRSRKKHGTARLICPLQFNHGRRPVVDQVFYSATEAHVAWFAFFFLPFWMEMDDQ